MYVVLTSLVFVYRLIAEVSAFGRVCWFLLCALHLFVHLQPSSSVLAFWLSGCILLLIWANSKKAFLLQPLIWLVNKVFPFPFMSNLSAFFSLLLLNLWYSSCFYVYWLASLFLCRWRAGIGALPCVTGFWLLSSSSSSSSILTTLTTLGITSWFWTSWALTPWNSCYI